MTKDLQVVNEIATIVEDPDTTPMSVRLPTKEEKILPKEEVEEKNHHQEKGGVEMIIINENPLGEARKEVPSQGPTMTKDLRVMNVIAKIVEDPDTSPMNVRLLQKERRLT